MNEESSYIDPPIISQKTSTELTPNKLVTDELVTDDKESNYGVFLLILDFKYLDFHLNILFHN